MTSLPGEDNLSPRNDHQPCALGQRTGADWGAAGRCLAARAILGGWDSEVRSRPCLVYLQAFSGCWWGSAGLLMGMGGAVAWG